MSIWTEVTIKANLDSRISLKEVFKAHCDETYVNIVKSEMNHHTKRNSIVAHVSYYMNSDGKPIEAPESD